MLTVVNADGSTPNGSLIDEIVREGARRMLAAALEAEVNAYIAELAGERDESGHRLVVRNGHHQPRKVTTSAGVVEVKAPRVNDKRIDEATGERKRFSSAILPPWARKSPKISEVLPLLYLHGLSSGDFVPALEQFLGSSSGLSPATVTRLTVQWQADHRAFMDRDLSSTDYVYVWADGVHLRIRLEEAKAAVLVLMGVRADGTKELIAMTDGYRESSEAWAGLLRDCARRGMRAPVLAVGDGALGFWNALNEVFPDTRHQRCWVHRTRKESTCRCVGLPVRGGEEIGGGAVAGGSRGWEESAFRKQGPDLADDVPDRGPAHVPQCVGEDVQGAQFPQVEEGDHDALSVTELLGEDAAAAARLAIGAPALIGGPFDLRELAWGEAASECIQVRAGHAGKPWVGQALHDPGAGWGLVGVEEGHQRVRRGEPAGGVSGLMAVVLQDPAGLGDEVADAFGGDLQHVGQQLHRAHLPLVEEREHHTGAVIEQRLGPLIASGAPGPATALLAVAFLGPGGLQRGQLGA